MARVDADAVLDEMAAWIATEKTGYGRSELLERIAALRQRHRVSEGILERALRLHGGRISVAVQPPEDVPAAGGEVELDDGKATDLGPSTTRGGHDGEGPRAGRAGRAPVGAGV